MMRGRWGIAPTFLNIALYLSLRSSRLFTILQHFDNLLWQLALFSQTVHFIRIIAITDHHLNFTARPSQNIDRIVMRYIQKGLSIHTQNLHSNFEHSTSVNRSTGQDFRNKNARIIFPQRITGIISAAFYVHSQGLSLSTSKLHFLSANKIIFHFTKRMDEVLFKIVLFCLPGILLEVGAS